MKKVFSLFLLLLFAAYIFAQETPSPETKIQTNVEQSQTNENTYNRLQVGLTGYIPYFGTTLISSTTLLLPQDIMNQFFCVESALLNIPALITNLDYTIAGTGINSAIWATGIHMSNYPYIYGNPSLSNTFMNEGFKGNMWLQYKGYEKARTKADPGNYPDFELVELKDAVFAPYNINILSKKSVWIPTLAYSVTAAGVLCLNGFDNSVFATKTSYIGNYQVPVAFGAVTVLALSCLNYTLTGVGEEALFRGVGYEQMKIDFGLVPAKIIDALVFPSAHIPQQVVSGYDWTSILITTLYQSATTLLLQWVYDKGGLKDSIAVHMWIDVVTTLCTYLLTTGTVNNNFALNLSFSTKF